MKSPRAEGLLAHQWSGYGRFHASRRNLLIHIVAVPVFIAGNVIVVASIATVSLVGVFAGALMTIGSLLAQSRGHRGEAVAAEPFTGPVNAVTRLIAEQWITFPRFVLRGEWLSALSRAK